jgi:hypothetical protein
VEPGRSDCILPAWDPGTAWPFPGIEPVEGFLVTDEAGDAGDPGVDITSVGFARVELPEGGALAAVGADAAGLAVLGSPDAAGPYLVVHLATAGAPGPLDGRAARYGIATDVDGKTRNDRPARPAKEFDPLSGSQLVHEIVVGESGTVLGFTDLARKAVRGSVRDNASKRADFLALVPPGVNGITIVTPAAQVGEWFRPIASREAAPVAAGRDPGSIAGRDPGSIAGRDPGSIAARAVALLVAGGPADDADGESDWAGDGDRPIRTNGDSAGDGKMHAELLRKPVTIPQIVSPPTGPNVHTIADYVAPAQVVVYDCERLSEEEAAIIEDLLASRKRNGKSPFSASVILEGEGPPFRQEVPIDVVVEREPIGPVLYIRVRVGVAPSGIRNLRDWEFATIPGLEDLINDKFFSFGLQLWGVYVTNGSGGLVGTPDPTFDELFDG